MDLLTLLKSPWPWYVAGPLIGLTVPTLLIIGNRAFGLSSSLRHLCAACIPTKVPFFNYNWKSEIWNLYFVFGVLLGAIFSSTFLGNPEAIQISPALSSELASYGITEINELMPKQLFNWANLATIKGFFAMVVGGFLLGFGTRYGAGCTSGHAIFGLSTLQWPSLVATCCFMLGGFLMANFILPLILSL